MTKKEMTIKVDVNKMCNMMNELMTEQSIRNEAKDIKDVMQTLWGYGILTRDEYEAFRNYIKEKMENRLEELK